MNPQDPQQPLSQPVPPPPVPPQPPYPQAPQPQPVQHQHQPVAYDAHGRPLYAHPPATPAQPAPMPQPDAQQNGDPQYVHLVRPVDPPRQEATPEIKAKHEESAKRFPFLNLSESEFVIRAVRRHPIGLFIPMFIGVLLLTIGLTVLVSSEQIVDSMALSIEPATLIVPALLFLALVGLGMFIVYYVYVNNKFFLTNESVIQEIQTTLFSRNEQTVSLGNIEDASFTQTNIIQHLFNYGSIRLSTEGDETTYRFTYVANPKSHIAVLNNAVEAFKLGRPVDPDEYDETK